MVRRVLTPALMVTVSPLLLASCRPERPAETPPNVLIILVDTLRTDKLGCYGNDLGLTPRIDRLASEGFLFEHAFAHAPWTLPSVASLLTSTYPGQHGAGKRLGRRADFTPLASDVRTFAECLRDQGYQTGAIVNVRFLHEKFGIGRGFDWYDFRGARDDLRDSRCAGEVTDLAIAWMKERRKHPEQPFLLMAHYFDPHVTYDPPEAFRKRFALPIDHSPDDELFGTGQDVIRLRRGEIDPATVPFERLERLYNGEIAYADEQIGRLLDALERLDLDGSTAVVMTADHGEEFLDHDGFEHGHTLYDELIHIPLILRYPGVIKTGRTPVTVGQIDVAPTLCRLAGIIPESTFQGQSLGPVMQAESSADRMILSQGNFWGATWLACLRNDGYKLIEKPGRIELYHVAVDQKEQRDLSGEEDRRERCAAMSADLATLLKTAKARGSRQGVSVRLSEEDLRRLEALGYIDRTADGETPAGELGAPIRPATQPASSSNGEGQRD